MVNRPAYELQALIIAVCNQLAKPAQRGRARVTVDDEKGVLEENPIGILSVSFTIAAAIHPVMDAAGLLDRKAEDGIWYGVQRIIEAARAIALGFISFGDI